MNFKKSDDAALIRLIADEDTGALEELYARYTRLVFSVALTIVNDHSVAEEVALDVFVHVWRGAATYRPERAKVSTWLVAIARHHAIDILRRQRARLDAKSLNLDDISLVGDSNTADPEESAELTSQREYIRGAVAQLPAEQKQALILAYFSGYTHQQISELLEQPLGTVKTRIRIAMQKLRQLLLQEDEPSDKSEDAQVAYPIDGKE